jgi:hypothetical protein
MYRKNDPEINWLRIMHLMSLILPVTGFTAAVVQIAVSGFKTNYVMAGLVLVIGVGHASRYLYRRSKNLQAIFMTTIIYPDTQPIGGLMDKLIMFFGASLIFVAFFLPFFRECEQYGVRFCLVCAQ